MTKPAITLYIKLSINCCLLNDFQFDSYFAAEQTTHSWSNSGVAEGTKTPEGWKDDIDLQVDEMKAKEERRICPVCQTTMERTRRKCINPDCRVKPGSRLLHS